MQPHYLDISPAIRPGRKCLLFRVGIHIC